MKFGFKFGLLGSGKGGSGGPPTLPHVPKVLSSIVHKNTKNGILVTWDRPIIPSAHAEQAINIIINGGAPVHPIRIETQAQHPNMMGFIMPSSFHSGDVITWAYNDQHPTESLKDANGVSPDNQTYAVANHSDGVTADSTAVSADSTQHTADEG